MKASNLAALALLTLSFPALTPAQAGIPSSASVSCLCERGPTPQDSQTLCIEHQRVLLTEEAHYLFRRYKGPRTRALAFWISLGVISPRDIVRISETCRLAGEEDPSLLNCRLSARVLD